MKKQNVKSKKQSKPAMMPEIPSDVLGSYTGVPIDNDEPTQDVDDL